MKSRANFPHRVCTSWLRRNISSYCASVSPDVARAGSTHTFAGCPLCWTGWHALDGATIPAEDMDAPVSTLPLSGGRDPLFESRDGVRSEPVMGWRGAVGVNRKRGGGGRSGEFMHLCLQDLPLSARHSFGRGHSPEAPVSTDPPCLSTMPCLSPVMCPWVKSAFGRTALGVDLSVKLFACRLTFVF